MRVRQVPGFQRLLSLLAITALAGCFDPKTGRFFDPFTGQDIDPPVITFLTASGTVLNDDQVCFRVMDDGGFDPDDIFAASGMTLSVVARPTTGEFGAGISGLADGTHTIKVDVTDLAGNEDTASTDVEVDQTEPTIDDFNVPSDQSSSASSLTLNWSWSIGDVNVINLSHFEVRDAGPDAVVGTGDDLAVPQGTGGGQADSPIQDVACTNGNCSAAVTIFNGVTTPGGSATRIFYARVGASDAAKGCTGQDNPNTTTDNSPSSTIVWLGPSGSMFPTGAQIPGSYAFTANRTSATSGCPAPLAASGTDTKTSSSGNVGVTGLDPQQTSPITGAYNETNGTYSGSASVLLTNGFRVNTSLSGTFTLQGQTILFDGEMVRVHVFPSPPAPPNTVACTETYDVTQTRPLTPSSRRFKRDVVGLLPDGVTLLGLRPVAFRYVEPYGDPAIPQMGLIAEEVAEIFPEAVVLEAAGRPEAIVYEVLAERVAEVAASRVGRAVETAIARLAEAVKE
jgi:hypothetical protein